MERVWAALATYNQEKYVAQAIEGALDQRVTLPYTLLIRDDASSDGTRGIIEKYRNKHSDKIFPIFEKENRRSQGVPYQRDIAAAIYARTSFTARRKTFVALCDGDDYWSDPLKLSRQVAIMQGNRRVSIVHHRARFDVLGPLAETYAESLRRHLRKFEPHPAFRRGSDLADGNFILTSTAMIRLSGWKLRELNNRNTQMLNDWVTFFLATRGKLIAFLDEEMGAYRIHSNSSFSSKSAAHRAARWQASVDYLREIGALK